MSSVQELLSQINAGQVKRTGAVEKKPKGAGRGRGKAGEDGKSGNAPGTAAVQVASTSNTTKISEMRQKLKVGYQF